MWLEGYADAQCLLTKCSGGDNTMLDYEALYACKLQGTASKFGFRVTSKSGVWSMWLPVCLQSMWVRDGGAPQQKPACYFGNQVALIVAHQDAGGVAFCF